MTDFTPWTAMAGGLLIGLSAVLLMAFHGRIAGLSGVLGGLLPPFSFDWQWRVAFLAGAVIGPAIYMALAGPIEFFVPAGPTALVIGGLIVGIGVTFGNGCPSGHGVCGMARLSPRSFVATLTFMATALVTVFLLRHVF
ncbi:YeeE/YedE family protein [Rhizobium sp. LjRoot254]|uniref:YeeE/YedE family protein n=1 Tax=Rhizobium sp. LjRoot254 TaxID=3342297 RepID=UPI003ECE113B